MKYSKLTTCAVATCLSLLTQPAVSAEFGLFGDVNYSGNSASGSTSGFSLGGLDFYATTNITDNTRVFIEYVFEDGGDGLVTDLERLWISRRFGDELTLAFGRFHSPLGVWNRSYHHGALLQDTASRPFFLDFEDGAAGILPVHVVGALANGAISLASGEINYEAHISNGSSIDTSIAGLAATANNKPELDINVASDPDTSKTFGLRVTYTLDDAPLTLGIMYMNNSIAESAETGGLISAGGALIDQTITGLDLNFDGENIILLAEYYSLSNDSTVGDAQQHTSTAWYVQAGYKFNETNRVVYRRANLNFDATDAYYLLLGAAPASHDVIAYRFDLDATNAIKFEINNNNPDTGASDTSYTAQWSFMAP